MFKFKKNKTNKTGVQTPEFRKPTPPPPPPTSGSNVVKPNPNYVPPASVKKSCVYSTPCGYCTKWDKKCDKKIGPISKNKVLSQDPCLDCCHFNQAPSPECCKRCNGENDYKYFIDCSHKDPVLEDIKSGKGLSRLDATLDPNKPLPSGIRKETIR